MPYPSAYLVIGPLTEDATVKPEENPCSSAILLNKVLEAVILTQGPHRIHAHQALHNKPVKLEPHCRPSNSLIIGTNKA